MLNRSRILLLIFAGLRVPGVAQPEAELRPMARILKVGVVDVESGKRALVEDEAVDLMGAARNYRGRYFVALVQPRGQDRYLAAAVSSAEPGNVFTLGGVRFPSRECDLLVGIFPNPLIRPGTWVTEEQVHQALAVSERVPVTALRPVSVMAQTTNEGPGGADIAITSIDNQSVSPTQKLVTPVSTDITARAQLLPPGSWAYLSIRVPYTNKCVLHRASKGSEPGSYIFRDVLFEAAGDPLVIHFNLMALATTLHLPEGLIACDTLPRDQLITSPTIDVAVDRKRGRIDAERVPFIAITRVGRQDIARGAAPAAALTARQGDSIEVGAGERLPQGGVLTIWTRERGSQLWLVSPPLVPRGSSTQQGDGQPTVTWVLPSTRFSSPDVAGQDAAEYEAMAVLSTAMFPNTWLNTSALAQHSIETVSEIVSVRLRDPDPAFDLNLSVESVCGQEVSEGRAAQARRGCSVVAESRHSVPPFLHVIVAGHLIGTDSWTAAQAIRNGRTFTVPDFPLTGDDPDAQWQLVALASPGALPAATMKYADFLPHVPQTSGVVMVARKPSGPVGLDGQDEPGRTAIGSLSRAASTTTGRIDFMFPLFLLLIAIAILMLVEWQFGVVSEVSGWAAGRFERELNRLNEQFEIPAKVNVSGFLLGVAILGFLIWLIATQYLRLYTQIVGAVTNLDVRDSRGWATYLVVMTALTGVFMDVSHRIAAKREREKADLFRAITAVLVFGALALWAFSGALYFEFLRRTSAGLVPPLGAVAAFLVAVIETLGFFFGTHLALDSLGWLVVRILLLPFYLLAMFLRLLQNIFERRRRIPAPPPAPEPEPEPEAPRAAPILGGAAGD